MSDTILNKKKTPFMFGFAAFVISAAGLIYAQSFVKPLLLALFISIICAQPISWLQKKKVPQGLAVTLVLVSIIFIFIGFGELIGASLSSFSEDAPKYEENLLIIGDSIFKFLEEYGINVSSDKISKVVNPSKVMGLTAGLLGQIGGALGDVLTIFFLVLFLLLELDSFDIKAKVLEKESKDSMKFLDSIGNSIRHYLTIKTLTSLLTGTLVWISLLIIGVDYAIIWAMIAFLLNYIPNFGSIIAAVPAVLFSLVQLGFTGALWTIIVFVAINMIVGNAIEPKVMGKGLGLSTFVVFLSLLFWGFLLDTVGMFLSVPLTMAIKIILEQKQSTKWIAVLLGTQEEAEVVLKPEIQ